MMRYISLLRGVNVGGKNSLPMKELRALLAGLGFENIATYIQSGNCVFDAASDSLADISESIQTSILEAFGFTPQVMTFTQSAYADIVKAVPYKQAQDDPKSIHIFFLAQPAANADLQGLESLRKESEAFALTDQAFYLYAPEGIGRSKLAARAEKKLGVATTARNFRSAVKIAELASG